MDIATYDHLDMTARAGLSSWMHEAIFAPVTFEMTGFPTRIRHIEQLRGILQGVHGNARVPGYVEELGGVTTQDLDSMAWAVSDYADWHRATFIEPGGTLPLGDLMAAYLAAGKAATLAPIGGRVLEIGPGLGFTGMLLAGNNDALTYHAIEIAQPLYILQAQIGAWCFRDLFRNEAMRRRGRPAFRAERCPRDGGHGPFMIPGPTPPRVTLYPWWRMEMPLDMAARPSRPGYDVIMSNGNIAEMTGQALDWYLPRWHAALADTGYLLIQDLGKVTTRPLEQILPKFDAAGFRALVKGQGQVGTKRLAIGNLLLVTRHHPHWEMARPVAESPFFIAEASAAVAAAYRLDVQADKLTPAGLAEAIGLVPEEPHAAAEAAD